MKAKVVELVGVKLDPNAKYLILVEPSVHPEAVRAIGDGLLELIGPSFVIGIVPDPQNAIKVFEFADATDDRKHTESQANTKQSAS